jgi:hypothetical protein
LIYESNLFFSPNHFAASRRPFRFGVWRRSDGNPTARDRISSASGY